MNRLPLLRIERRSIEYIPSVERHGKPWHLWPVWFSGDAHLATVATGVVGFALGGGLLWMMLAVVTGCAFGTFFMAFHSTQGPQLGLPQMIQSRPQFGYRGALLVWGVALLAYVGFNAFNQILAAQTLSALYGAPPIATTVAFSLLSVALAAVGYDLIHVVQRAVAYLIIAALLIFSAAAAANLAIPAEMLTWGRFPAVAFLAQFFAAASYQISWSIYVSDYSRYLPREVGVRACFYWTYFGAFLGGAWMMLVGTLAASLYPRAEVTEALRSIADAALSGFGKPLLLVSLLGLAAISALNYYGASLTLLSALDCFAPRSSSRAGRLGALLFAAIAATSIALVSTHDFVGRFGEFLAILLYLFTPWTAINLVDFYWIRRGHYSVREIFNPAGMYGLWNWRGLTAYAAGFVAMVPFFSTGLYTGPVAKRLHGADIAMLIGLPVSALIYMWTCASFNRDEDRERAAQADADLA